MHTLMLWSVMVVFVLATYSSSRSSCNKFWMAGRCSYVSGPAISCSRQLYDHVVTIDKIHLQFPRGSTYSKKKLRYLERYKLKITFDKLEYFVIETVVQQPNASRKTCISIDGIKQSSQALDSALTTLSPFFLWMDYFYPIFGTILFIFGMVGNLLIVLMYSRHQELQTVSNMVVLNVAMGDVFLLINYIPCAYITGRWIKTETFLNTQWVFQYLFVVSITVSVYFRIFLNLMTYLAVYATPGSRTQKFVQNNQMICWMLVLFWFLAAVTGICQPLNSLYISDIQVKLALRYLRFVSHFTLPLIFIAVFSVCTTRVLRRSIPGEQTTAMLKEIHARKRGANVLLSLVILFFLTHLPYNIILLIQAFENLHYLYTTQLLMTLNSCLYPVSLFINSRHFHKHLKNDLTKLKHKITQLLNTHLFAQCM